jgi:hypothetical protein
MAGGGGGYFGGTPADSVIAFALGSGPAPAPPPPPPRLESRAAPKRDAGRPVTLPDAPGRALVQRTCGMQCHNVDAALSLRRDRAAWTAMVENMVARGARANEAQTREIIDYLVQHFGR